MGKYLTSLLILASALLWPEEIFADEQVRRVQEELRKRHLFYANANGEKGPALTRALKRYQQKKGFAPTGVIDSVTLTSLGIRTPAPFAATTPVVIGRRGQVHGANGESLPHYPPFLWPDEETGNKFDPAVSNRDHEYIELTLADFRRHGTSRRHAGSQRARLIEPMEDEFDPLTQQIRHDTANPVWFTLALQQPAAGEFAEFGTTEGERMLPPAAKPDRRPQRRTRRVKPRKETNPFVLTYQSVDRAIRSLFGDTQTKKKRSSSKRL